MVLFGEMETALDYVIRVLDAKESSSLYVLGLEDNIREEVSVHHDIADGLLETLNNATEYNDDVFAVAFKVWRESDKAVVDRLLADGVERITSKDLEHSGLDDVLAGDGVFFKANINLDTDELGKFHLV